LNREYISRSRTAQGRTAPAHPRHGREINYSATTIYLYFRDKDALFQALLRETFRRLSRAVTLAVTHRDPVKGLHQAMRACITFGLEHPEHYRLLFMVRPSLAIPFNLLRHQVGLCIASGRFLERDQELVAQGGWVVVHGITSMLLNRPGLGGGRLTEHILSSHLRGLSVPSAEPSLALDRK
jgi:AcrR family transcriptional regulator